MRSEEFQDSLWQDYIQVTPQASRIQQLFIDQGNAIVNDHVAFRTFNNLPINIENLEPVLLGLGYQVFDDYCFEQKQLDARAYLPADQKMPRVFLSELRVSSLPKSAQKIINRFSHFLSSSMTVSPAVFFSGRPWPMPSWSDYCSLLEVSEYAAWLSIMGLRPNHFTISINHLNDPNINTVVETLTDAGYAMNEAGGIIKGDPEALLEQCSTMADKLTLTFADGDQHAVSSCYYEFAKRYKDAGGNLYQGFVLANADKIFHSTDSKA